VDEVRDENGLFVSPVSADLVCTQSIFAAGVSVLGDELIRLIGEYLWYKGTQGCMTLGHREGSMVFVIWDIEEH
jgi:hypothetical protein